MCEAHVYGRGNPSPTWVWIDCIVVAVRIVRCVHFRETDALQHIRYAKCLMCYRPYIGLGCR